MVGVDVGCTDVNEERGKKSKEGQSIGIAEVLRGNFYVRQILRNGWAACRE